MKWIEVERAMGSCGEITGMRKALNQMLVTELRIKNFNILRPCP